MLTFLNTLKGANLAKKSQVSMLIEEKQTSRQEPECGNEGEKMRSRGRLGIFLGFVSSLLIYLAMGKQWAYIENT